MSKEKKSVLPDHKALSVVNVQGGQVMVSHTVIDGKIVDTEISTVDVKVHIWAKFTKLAYEIFYRVK